MEKRNIRENSFFCLGCSQTFSFQGEKIRADGKKFCNFCH
jgi:hypothetical protein